MGFLSVVIALLLEQVRPLESENPGYGSVRGLAGWLEHNFNAGEPEQGTLAWLVLVVPLTLLSWGIFALAVRVHLFLGLGWEILVLYFTLGFRQFSHAYTAIQLALANNDLIAARRILADWRGHYYPQINFHELSPGEISRIAIEEALVASHRHVFGVFFWFVVLPGPSGAVLYRLAEYLARAWNEPDELRGEPFGRFAQRAFRVIDWVPVRLTAIGFAVMGNFEDAMFAWRNLVPQWNDVTRGILLAVGSGALGVRLGDAHSVRSDAVLEPDLGGESIPGVEAQPAALQSAVGLVWRSLILWLGVLLLLSLAGLFG